MANDRNPRNWGLPWVLASSLMTLIGMVVLIAAGIIDAGGWSAFLIGPIVLAGVALTLAVVVIRRMRAGHHTANTRHPAE